MSGQQLHERINCVLSRVGRSNLAEPPAPVVSGPSPEGELAITNDQDGVRLFPRVTAGVGEDIMVFGQAPCSAGRSKRWNVAYLGLLGSVVDGLAEKTDLYVGWFGAPRAGTKVFVVTCQQQDGWEATRCEANEIVPSQPAEHA